MSQSVSPFAGERLAKVIARVGLCSRRDAEAWIKEGRVAVNGKLIRTPAFNVGEKDEVKVDGRPLAQREGTRVWLYHKPEGLVVTEKDPEGRPTVFEKLAAQGLPRVVSVGRLDINTEGLLLLTNDGGLKRVLELPATGWLRRYRVRAFGRVTEAALKGLAVGITVEGVHYGPIEATLEREQGSNVWLTLGLREGKNREVKNVLETLGLTVNRLIRVSYGPFQLGDLPIGGIEVVKAKVLREQLGPRLAAAAGVDFESALPEPTAVRQARVDRPKPRGPAPRGPALHGSGPPGSGPHGSARGRFEAEPAPHSGPRRKIIHDDGSTSTFEPKLYGKKPRSEPGAERPARPGFGKDDAGPRPPRGSARPGFGKDEAGPRPPRGPARPGFAKDNAGPRPPRGSARPGFSKDDAGPRPPRGPAPPGFAKDDAGPRPRRGSARPSFGKDDARPRPPRGPARPSFGKDDARPRPPRDSVGAGPKRPRGSGPQGDRPRRPRPPKV